MKVIECPSAVKVPVGKEEFEIEFKKFLTDSMDLYEPLGKGPKNARQAAKIFDVIEKANGSIALEDADFEVLKSACESAKWIPAVNRRFVPFYEAMEKAEEVKSHK